GFTQTDRLAHGTAPPRGGRFSAPAARGAGAARARGARAGLRNPVAARAAMAARFGCVVMAKGPEFPPGPCDFAFGVDQSFSAGMICFLRDMMPGRTTVSPVTFAPKEASASCFTRSLGTSSVASSLMMSTTKSRT
ncbi:MAG: hypothetical protein RL216_2528, partial [Pseudomonadota bacterium]